MKLSRTVTYALKATLQLAQMHNESPIPCSRLAAEGKMPERFLLQILRSLVTQGILQSRRGVDGGYILTRDAAEISVLDVIEAIEGPLQQDVVFGEQGLPSESRQRLTRALQSVAQTTRTQLEEIKLAQLIRPTA